MYLCDNCVYKKHIYGSIYTEMGPELSLSVHESFLLHSVQTSSVANPVSYSHWVPAALSLGVKRQECEVDCWPPPRAKVKNGGAITPLPHESPWYSA
jgi:hypothetical protein